MLPPEMLQQVSILQARDEAVETFEEKVKMTAVDRGNPGKWRRSVPDESAFVKREKTVRNGLSHVKPYESPRPESVGVTFTPGEAQASSGVDHSAAGLAKERLWLNMFYALETLEPHLDKAYLPRPENYITVSRLLSELIENTMQRIGSVLRRSTRGTVWQTQRMFRLCGTSRRINCMMSFQPLTILQTGGRKLSSRHRPLHRTWRRSLRTVSL